MRVLRTAASALSVLTVALGLMTPPALAVQDPERLASSVRIDETNSREVTKSSQGNGALESFVNRVTKLAPELKLKSRSSASRSEEYRVLEVDVAKVLPEPECPRVKETLILPRRITSIRYKSGNIDTAEPAKPCAYTVIWDDPPVPTTENDDPASNGRFSALAEPYTEPYGQYCASRTPNSGGNIGWNDACVVYYVEKNDGNATWNFYSSHVKSSCGANGYGNGVLTSCGRGVEMVSPGQWVDWAPGDGITQNCRTISNSVTLFHFDVGYNYTSCDEQRAYKYAEPGKMSTYWKGEQGQSGTSNNQILGGTSHHVSVRVPQADGRPSWSHWWNSDAYYCGGLGLPFCL